jgi:hypothetical protein
MVEIKVSEGQSLIDISLWMLGGADALYALADANGLAITDTVAAGQVLVVPDELAVNPELVKFLKEKGVTVNTANIVPVPDPVDDELTDWLDDDFDNPDYF